MKWVTGVAACLSATTLCVVAPAAAEPELRPVTLEEAIALAQRNAPAAIQAAGQIRTTAAATRASWAAFLPSVSVSASGSRQLPSQGAVTRIENGQVVTLAPETWSYGIGLSASVDVFDGGRRWFALRQARARAEAARVDQTAERFAVALAVQQNFFDVLAARETGAAADAQLAQAERQLTTSIAKVRAHAATRSDSLRAEIQVRNARLAQLDARTAEQLANASLTRVVGTPYTVTAAPGDTLTPAGLAVDDSTLARLVDDGPGVRAARSQLAAARAARASAWTAYSPSLSASYSRSGNGAGDVLFPSPDVFSYTGSLRLSLNFPLFNQLQREQQLVQAQVAEANAQAALRDAQLAARADLAQQLGTYHAARERVAAQTATLEAAEEDLRVQQQRYTLGNSTLLDLLTSQTQLDQARRDLIRARYDLRIARAQLEALAGRKL